MAISVPKQRKLAVIILAAGKGTRMNNPGMAKVMYPIDGHPMVEFVVDLAGTLQAQRILAVVGWQRDTVVDYLGGLGKNVEFVDQREQLGTGHAVQQAAPVLKEFDGDVLILSGDVPLLMEKTARALVGYHHTTDAVATILTAELDDPTGYGRVIRNADGSVKKIVEHKDASEEERSIREINSGIYVFQTKPLFSALARLTPNNVQGEYYLTDVFETFWREQARVSAVKAIDPVEIMGINTLEQLETARVLMSERLLQRSPG